MFELFDPEAETRITHGTNLPHWFQAGVTYFVTFRTDDSIPQHVSRRWYAERADWLKQNGISPGNPDWKSLFDKLPVEKRKQFHNTFSKQFRDNLDQGWGECVLRQPALSTIVADSLLHFDGERYHMGDFVVMPNHVHLLVCLRGETDIVDQCYSWKKYSAGKINTALHRSGRFWQEDSFDHLVRSLGQFQAIQNYIAENPRNLREGDFLLHSKVAGTLRVPSANIIR